MAIPLVVSESVFAAASASATTVLNTLNTEFTKCVSIIYEVTLAAFTGTIDFQSTTPPGGTQRNVFWVELDVESAPETDNQLVFSGESGVRRYLIPMSGVQPRIVMARSGGTITANVLGYGVHLPPTSATLISALTGTPVSTLASLSTQLSTLISVAGEMLGGINKLTSSIDDDVDRSETLS